jgi:hypothetical protein
MITGDDTKPWYQQFWPWFLIGLPTAVVMACFYTVYLAVDHPLSIVKEDYYKEGLAINQDQRRYARARELQMAARCSRVGSHIECEFISGLEALGGDPLQLQLMHPVNSDKDIHLSLHPLDPSRYQSDELDAPVTDSLVNEQRWYAYLESVPGKWALQTEGSLAENTPLRFKSEP